MLGLDPRLTIVDLTHEVRPFSIPDAARFLAGATLYYPAGAVFLVVVDPGVGGARRPMVAVSGRRQLFVLPDNGVITLVAERDGLRAAREITNPAWMLGGTPSTTFHGRDVFSPTAARLARGDDWRDVGPPIPDPVRISLPGVTLDGAGLAASVIGLDGPFGNVITNATAADLARLGWGIGDTVPVRIGGEDLRVAFARTFGDVPVGAALLYVTSRGQLGFAVNQGDFAARHRVAVPTPVFIPRKAGE
jgi:S-adenosylmethionine hydrolase